MAHARHLLSDRNPETLKATCSACGPNAEIRKQGRSFACVQGRREASIRYKKAHPDRAAADRKFKPSPHRLQNRKGGPDTCAICGPVESIAHGWGYMCPVRAKELGWQAQKAPQPKCPRCLSRHLDNMGACPLCDAPLPRYDGRPGKTFDIGGDRSNFSWSDFEKEAYEAGLAIYENPSGLPDENESVVHGWKTLGYDDTGVRPEYAKLYGGKQ